jgi:energy-coupling factor transporter ATP-binding protein EcfA2
MEIGEKIIGMFNDVPLSEKEKRLFVNRRKEILKLTNIGRFMQKSIYGVAGETGCGKTTLFNMLKFPEGIQKIVITITEKESKETIIADLLYKLCELVLHNGKFRKIFPLTKRIINFLEQEEIKSREKGIKVGKILEGESRWASYAKTRYTIKALKDRFQEIITGITSYTKIVLCIDEIDKERKEDAVIILDSIKESLKVKNLSCLVALPPVMYKQYLEDRESLFSEANLENILKDILPINKMKDEEIKEILEKRTNSFPEILSEEVTKVVIQFADGNPREALLLCQNAILSKNIGQSYKKEDFILSLDEIKSAMEKFLRLRIERLKLSVREDELLRIILAKKGIIDRKELYRMVTTKSKMAKSTLHKTVNKLLEKKALIEIEKGLYKVDRRILLGYRYLQFR